MTACYRRACKKENDMRERGERNEVISRPLAAGNSKDTHVQCGHAKNGTYETEGDARREKGDAWSRYRYRL